MKKNNMIRIKFFRFIKEVFLRGSLFLSSLISTTPLTCISMINQASRELMKQDT